MIFQVFSFPIIPPDWSSPEESDNQIHDFHNLDGTATLTDIIISILFGHNNDSLLLGAIVLIGMKYEL